MGDRCQRADFDSSSVAEMKTKVRIAVLGPGAIGGLLSALCWRAGHDVLCVIRAQAAVQLQADGLCIESPVYGSFVARPRVAERLQESIDVLFVTLKAPSLFNALCALDRDCLGAAVVIPLLNGVGHREFLRDQLGQRVAVGTIGLIEAVRESSRIIRHHSQGYPHIDLASDRDVARPWVESLATVLRDAGLPTSVLRTEAEVIWRKLARLSAVASSTAAFQLPLGAIRADFDRRALLEGAACEAVAVAQREGVELDEEQVLAQIKSFPDRLTTSLQRDVGAGRPSEVDAITGGVIHLAERYGISVPAHRRLFEMITERIARVGAIEQVESSS